MAKPKIDAGTLYKVDLIKSVHVGRVVINPAMGDRNKPRIRGDALAAIIEKDASAVKNYEAV
ncbi:hypothetical protein [Brucella sp. 2280]|uniref:hypothetical protein n=1 Tax=Brucella sp. 2280 TaxID=2592625 RepID=UPI001295D0AE|nr:hypothetical protein [Brucella sp. 2280]QGA57782.1 hypothetical protein GHC20_11705 [Brucella sp. 2280]